MRLNRRGGWIVEGMKMMRNRWLLGHKSVRTELQVNRSGKMELVMGEVEDQEQPTGAPVPWNVKSTVDDFGFWLKLP